MISTSSRTGEASSLNRDAPGTDLTEARAWVLHIQTKLHQWAKNDPTKRFDDLYNLVCHPATLAVAWDHVRRNRGSRTAGVDGQTRYHIERRHGVTRFLSETRSALRDRTFRPTLVRQRGIPKVSGKVRYLGIPAIASYCLLHRYSPESSFQVMRLGSPPAAFRLNLGGERDAEPASWGAARRQVAALNPVVDRVGAHAQTRGDLADAHFA